MSDRTATQTQTAAAPAAKPAQSGILQRQCACGQHTIAGGECEECKKKRETGSLQRAATSAAPVGAAPPIVHDVLRSPGRPLDPATRAFMEPRFGHDFSRVRIHDDSLAADSARAVSARAYTVGQNIAFDRGQYQPHTTEGAGLLAHELTHTVQQAGLRRAPANNAIAISSETDASEREASAAANSVMQGFRPAISARPSSLSLHRAPWGECPAGTKRTLNKEFGESLKQRAVAAGAEAAKE